MTPMPFDVIGDVHGQADALHRLLQLLDYRQEKGTWRHPGRTAIFVGDYIDAGPEQLRTVTTIRRMVEEGAAYSLMGNHELNAILWFTPDPDNPEDFLRSRFSAEWGAKNRKFVRPFFGDLRDSLSQSCCGVHLRHCARGVPSIQQEYSY